MELQGKRLQAGQRVALHTYMEEHQPTCTKERQPPSSTKALGSMPKRKPKKIEETEEAEDSENDLLEALITIQDQENKMKALKAKLEKALTKKAAGSDAVSENESEGAHSMPRDTSMQGYLRTDQ